jgi:hypothetical protein
VKIQKLHIDGFGRLNNAIFDLAPGLNIFGGPNEAGKSTLQQSILALLYGFYSSNRRTSAETELLEGYRPWQGSIYGGRLQYRLDCGHDFKVSRFVADGEIVTTLVDSRTGHDISDAFARDRLGSLDFPLKHFGVPRDVFVHTYFIRHADLGPLADVAYEVSDTIGDSTGASRRNRTVAQAEELLNQALAQEIGSKLSTSTPLAAADEHLHELLIEKTLIQLKYRNLAEDFVTQRRNKRSLREWTSERDELKYFLTLNRLNALTFRIREIDKLMAAETALHEQLHELESVADFPTKSRDVVRELAQQQRLHVERLARFEGMAAPARVQVEELQSAAARMREELRRLESARSVPVEYEPTVRELEHSLPDAIRAHQKVEGELASVRQSIAALEPARNAAARRKSLVSGGTEKIQALRLTWRGMQSQIADAEAEHAEVDEAWHVQALSESEYAELARKVTALTAQMLDRLRSRQGAADSLKTAADMNWKSRWARLLAVAGAVNGLIGVTLIIITLLDYATNWMVEGTVFTLAGLLVAAMARGLQVYGQRDHAAAAQAYAALNAQLKELGFESIRELETAQAHYARAEPLHEAWLHSKATLDKYYKERDALRAEILPLMELPEGTGISEEQLAGLETYTRDLSGELQELGRLELHERELVQELQQRREAMQTVIDTTRQILKSAGMVELNLLSDLRAFLVLCANRKELDKLEVQMQELAANLAAKLDSTLAVEADLRSERNKLTGIEEELRLVLANLGIQAEPVTDGIKLFNQRSEQAERYSRIQGILQSLERERKALLRSMSLEQLRKQADVFAQSLKALLASFPGLGEKKSDLSEETLEEKVFEIQHRINTTTHAMSAVEARLQVGTSDYRSLAQVEEEIAREQSRMETLAFEGRAINFALDQLAAAADDYHRNFLPRLNRLMASSLDAVTKGHYSKVQIDRADLRVQIEAPELQQLISPERLSRGVRDQVYLVLRFGLAEMISEGRESLPYLFDDPFVNYDTEHLMLTLNMLAAAAERSQLLLFTKDEVIVDWFKARQFDPAQHQLHLM